MTTHQITATDTPEELANMLEEGRTIQRGYIGAAFVTLKPEPARGRDKFCVLLREVRPNKYFPTAQSAVAFLLEAK